MKLSIGWNDRTIDDYVLIGKQLHRVYNGPVSSITSWASQELGIGGLTHILEDNAITDPPEIIGLIGEAAKIWLNDNNIEHFYIEDGILHVGMKK